MNPKDKPQPPACQTQKVAAKQRPGSFAVWGPPKSHGNDPTSSRFPQKMVDWWIKHFENRNDENSSSAIRGNRGY